MNPAHKCPEGWDATQLLAYVEGELEDSTCRRLERHVKVCPVCAEEMEALRRMDSLLKEHPESFHPDEEDLYGFVSSQRDPDGKIAAHLGSCGPCRNDAELLREMIAHRASPADPLPEMPRSLLRELERSEPASSPGMGARLLSAAVELFGLPFRVPVLALASAATILIIAVVGLPMWRLFQEHRLAEFSSVQKQRVPAVIEPSATPEKETAVKGALRADLPIAPGRVNSPKVAGEMPAAVHPSKTGAVSPTYPAEEKAERRKLSKSKTEIAHPGQNVVNLTTPSPAAPPAESKVAPYTSPEKPPVPAALEPRHARERQEAPAVGTGKPVLGMSAPRSSRHEFRRAAKKDALDYRGGSVTGSSAAVPLTIDITDAHGKPISWAKATLPSDLKRRFHLVKSEGDERDAVWDKASSLKDTSKDAKVMQGPALHIEIRISESIDAYDVDAKLFDASSHREIASVPVMRVSRAEVPGAIDSSVRRLLERK